MTKECKKARNAVLIPLAILIGLIMLCSSCMSTYTTCPAYASNETEAIHEDLTQEEYNELVAQEYSSDCENCDEID